MIVTPSDADKSDFSYDIFRRIIQVIKRILVACLVLVLALPLWNLAVAKWQQAHVVIPGSFYPVDGALMHLYCLGKGSPTVVIEAGLGSNWLDWQVVQPELARLTRVCSYDRSGLGWSEPRARPRDAEAIAHQLHTLLNEAAVQRPIVLTGHSAGGFYVREYAREFPEDLAGVVLVDSSSPQQFDELSGFRASYEANERIANRRLWSDRLQVWSGWRRLMGDCHYPAAKGLERLADLYDAESCRPGWVDGDIGEFLDFEAAAQEAARLASFRNLPLLVLSKDTHSFTNAGSQLRPADQKAWDSEQEALKSLSPLSWRVIARGSGHKIFLHRPELLVSEISRLIDYLHGGPPPAFGSTTTK